MTSQLGKAPSSYSELLCLRSPRAYRARRIAAFVLAVISPFICAWFATGPDRWDLFERSGSIPSAVGLLLASRRYLGRGVLELAMFHMNDESRSNIVEDLEDIYTSKLGLGLSAFGMIVWGWGEYLGWWSFGYLVVWALIEARNAWRDFVRLRDRPAVKTAEVSSFPQ